jgi:hypothetical protein
VAAGDGEAGCGDAGDACVRAAADGRRPLDTAFGGSRRREGSAGGRAAGLAGRPPNTGAVGGAVASPAGPRAAASRWSPQPVMAQSLDQVTRILAVGRRSRAAAPSASTARPRRGCSPRASSVRAPVTATLGQGERLGGFSSWSMSIMSMPLRRHGHGHGQLRVDDHHPGLVVLCCSAARRPAAGHRQCSEALPEPVTGPVPARRLLRSRVTGPARRRRSPVTAGPSRAA